MDEAIFTKVKTILVGVDNQQNVPVQLSPQTEWTDLNFGSLQTIDFILAIEDAFNFSVTDEELMAQEDWMHNLESIVNYIEERMR